MERSVKWLRSFRLLSFHRCDPPQPCFFNVIISKVNTQWRFVFGGRVKNSSQKTHSLTYQLASSPTNQPTNQSSNQPINQPTNQPANRPSKQATNRASSWRVTRVVGGQVMYAFFLFAPLCALWGPEGDVPSQEERLRSCVAFFTRKQTVHSNP